MAAVIQYYKSAKAGSLGGAITVNEVTNALLGDIFGNTTSEEAVAGKTEYACIYIKNTGDSLAEVVKEWILSNTPSADTADAIGVGTSGVNGVEQEVANKNTAPVGVTFSAAANEAACLNFPNLAAAQFHALWIRRITQPNASAIAIDNTVLRNKVDTI